MIYAIKTKIPLLAFSKQNKSESEKVNQMNDSETGKVSFKYLSEAGKPLSELAAEVRAFIKNNTIDCGDGLFAFKAARKNEIESRVSLYAESYGNLVRSVQDNWADLMDKEQELLGAKFDVMIYPDKYKLLEDYVFQYTISAVSETSINGRILTGDEMMESSVRQQVLDYIEKFKTAKRHSSKFKESVLEFLNGLSNVSDNPETLAVGNMLATVFGNLDNVGTIQRDAVFEAAVAKFQPRKLD